MKKYSLLIKIIILLFSFYSCSKAPYQPLTIESIYSDHAVIQRLAPIDVRGSVTPGDKVSVHFHDQVKTTTADNNGQWWLSLTPEVAGGPYKMIVENGTDTVILNDLLVGDVWLLAGQSNMDMKLKNTEEAAIEVSQAEHPLIRYVKIPYQISDYPRRNFKDPISWEICNPGNAEDFSAVGYYFAKEIAGENKVPVGLINCSVSGTKIETWISQEAIAKLEGYHQICQTKEGDLEGLDVQPNDYPGLLFNGMITPLFTESIRGILWYQGESNVQNAFQYRSVFPALINDWRSRWKNGTGMPFYYVQLPGNRGIDGNSEKGSEWAQLREAQQRALRLPATGMAVTIDVGDYEDLHPKNKKPIGKRLAAIALHHTYDRELPWSGPMFEKMEVVDHTAVISFKHTNGQLKTSNRGDLHVAGFELSGTDKIFYPAKALVKKDKVILTSGEVLHPIAVRYGWADYPANLDLYNKAGFPAAPFRTDDWDGEAGSKQYKPGIEPVRCLQ